MIESISASNNYTIAQILNDWWNDFKFDNAGNIRPVVIENVAKVRNCGNGKLGFSTYACPRCGEKKIVAHTCKSRFCNSCGKVKNDEWIERAQTRLFNVSHKHLVFTVPSELWLLFRRQPPAFIHAFSIGRSGHIGLGGDQTFPARTSNGSAHLRL